MTDPFAVLGVPLDADDTAIRQRYLELVKQFPPERHPEQFAAIRQAYEQIRDSESRVRYQLFEAGRGETVEAIVEDLARRIPRRRIPFQAIVKSVQSS